MPSTYESPAAYGEAGGADVSSDRGQIELTAPSSKKQLARDLIEVRRTWWRLRSQGIDLPAERGVIVIPNWWSR